LDADVQAEQVETDEGVGERSILIHFFLHLQFSKLADEWPGDGLQ
jgi:hypothetical protein